ncbi:MAG: class I SAM-dependent methyltransferase [Chlamydiae bacterium]|nr:class I SAM-dependent methyltransferase [Chlamydiota bacterium]
MSHPQCRFCSTPLFTTFCNLGKTPLSNSYLKDMQLKIHELVFPLHAYVCQNCLLVQLEEFQKPNQIFSDYAYFSSYSKSWLEHARNFVESVVKRFSISSIHQVIEIASNDGYLLQYFMEKKIPILGIEPAENVAKVAESKNIPTLVEFFGVSLAEYLVKKGKMADLLIGNNVLAHVPDINDFVKGMKLLLSPDGVITMEFPHLLNLIIHSQFDTIYHEHFSYLSLQVVEKIFSFHGLKIFDVEEVSSHGGSLRIYACHKESLRKTELSVSILRNKETENGLDSFDVYSSFELKVQKIKSDLLEKLIDLKTQGKKIVGYGAPAKGNTLLNFCSIGTDFLDYTVDLSPHKQGLYLPGTHIPIYAPEKIRETRPDFILILPWNLKHEIMQQMSYIKEWNAKWIVPIPNVEVI